MDRLSVLVVNSNPSFLRLLVRYIEDRHADALTVAGAAFRVRDALILAASYQPEAVIVGLSGVEVSGLAFVAEVRRVVPYARVVVIAPMAAAYYADAARAVGADACVASDQLRTDLIPALLSRRAVDPS